MSETLQRILELVRELPQGEREQASQLILETLADRDVDAAWAAEIERRRSNPGELVDAKEVVAELYRRQSVGR